MAPTIWGANRSSRPEILRQLRRVNLNDFHDHLRDLGRGRPNPQPVDELAHPSLLAAGEHLDATILKISRVAGNADLASALLGAGAVEDALYAARNQAAARDRLGFGLRICAHSA